VNQGKVLPVGGNLPLSMHHPLRQLRVGDGGVGGGSPTILVGGADVIPTTRGAGVGCAIGGAPDVECILAASQAQSG